MFAAALSTLAPTDADSWRFSGPGTPWEAVFRPRDGPGSCFPAPGPLGKLSTPHHTTARHGTQACTHATGARTHATDARTHALHATPHHATPRRGLLLVGFLLWAEGVSGLPGRAGKRIFPVYGRGVGQAPGMFMISEGQTNVIRMAFR